MRHQLVLFAYWTSPRGEVRYVTWHTFYPNPNKERSIV